MLSMTSDAELPKISLATPEDYKQASEKAMNFWVGALSPLWAPFFAASSFGLGAWALSRGLSQSESLMKDLPLAVQWPGFAPFWAKADLIPDAVEEATQAMSALPAAVVPEAEDTVEEAVAPVVEAAEQAVETVAEAAPEPVAPEPVTTMIDPVVEAPVVPAVTEAIAEPEVEVPAPLTPKPLAQELSVAKAKTEAAAPPVEAPKVKTKVKPKA